MRTASPIICSALIQVDCFLFLFVILYNRECTGVFEAARGHTVLALALS